MTESDPPRNPVGIAAVTGAVTLMGIGSVIAKAREKGINTPTLDTLSAIVKGLESHYMTAGKDA